MFKQIVLCTFLLSSPLFFAGKQDSTSNKLQAPLKRTDGPSCGSFCCHICIFSCILFTWRTKTDTTQQKSIANQTPKVKKLQ